MRIENNIMFNYIAGTDKSLKDNYYTFFKQAEKEFHKNFKSRIYDQCILLNQSHTSLLDTDRLYSHLLHDEDRILPRIGIWNYDPMSERLGWSDEVNTILSLPEGTIPSWSILKNMLHPGDRKWVMELLECKAPLDKGINISFRILNETGDVKYLYAQGEMVYNEDRIALGLIGILHDLTEKKRIEAENARLLHVIKHSRDEIYLFNSKTFKFEFLNIGALTNMGYTMDEMLNMTPIDIKPEFTKEDYLKLVHPLLNGKQERLVFETVHRRKDKSTYPVEIHLQRIEQDLGDVMMAIVLDISDRKKAEKAIQESQDLLEYQNTQLVDFCNIVSHNLRSPLANMSMLVDAIEESENEGDRQLFISKLKPVINNLHETFDELVESLQIRQDLEIISEEIPLEPLVKKQLECFEGQVTTLNAAIELDFSSAPIIKYPPKYISSILHNLISNALKYKSSDRTPAIKIKSVRKNKSIILSVEDNGMGIDLKKYKNKIFKIRKVFHDNPDAKGFGLFLTKTQVDVMGGEIWVESKPSKGSIFYIEMVNQFE
ncbi:sensor histidine kinase [Anditalea andensis]|uniref:histidine kinase n=1 Tax=Anditalea andensis TaxID=1048983 RepID=A0A074L2E8_9BACT|nr:HAMP domain-containing sensor histidine kinase [Anditalea andensis]KEO75359.1 hypothetical protein EL17_02130 [Anditalea andensis]